MKRLRYLFLLSVLDLLVPCPFVLRCLALGRNIPRQNWHQQHKRNERLFCPSVKQMGLLVHQTPPALAGQSSLAGSESCSSALKPGRSSCTFFHFYLNTSQDKAKSFSSEPMASQIKARLAVCFLVILQGMTYCLTG